MYPTNPPDCRNPARRNRNFAALPALTREALFPTIAFQ
jgi:hypothetical protein